MRPACRAETQVLVERVTKLAPKLIEDVVPKMACIAALQKVLLLEEGVHIRDMCSIVTQALAAPNRAALDPGVAEHLSCGSAAASSSTRSDGTGWLACPVLPSQPALLMA